MKNRCFYTIFSGMCMILLMSAVVLNSGCENRKTLRIGVVGTMSGPSSDLSVSGRRGAELAADQINKAGGILNMDVELVVKDDENDTNVALRQDKDFVAEGIELVIGHFTSGMVVESIDYINSQELLMLAPTVSVDSLSGMDDHFIRFIGSTQGQADVLVEHAAGRDYRRMTILYDRRNRGFTDALISNYQRLFYEKTGLKARVMAYNPQEEGEFDQAADEIMQHETDGLFIIAGAEDCARMAQRLKQEMPELDLYGPLWANTPELIRKGGRAVEGMMLVGGIDLEDDSSSFTAFESAYEARYGEPPTFASMYSYEAVMALRDAIGRAGSTDWEKVKATLLEIGQFSGIQGEFRIDAFGDNTRDYKLFEVVKGRTRKVE